LAGLHAAVHPCDLALEGARPGEEPRVLLAEEHGLLVLEPCLRAREARLFEPERDPVGGDPGVVPADVCASLLERVALGEVRARRGRDPALVARAARLAQVPAGRGEVAARLADLGER